MNNARRKQIRDVKFTIQFAAEKLEWLKQQEEEAHDNLPESLMDTDKALDMEENIEIMEEVIGTIYEACDNLSEMISK